MAPLSTRIRRALRSPWTITAEIVGIALGGLGSTLVEQHPTVAQRVRLREASPALAGLVQGLQLDRILTASWFLLLVLLAAGSLALVAWEQWRRARREWRRPPEAAFRNAPFRRELSRPATVAERTLSITTSARAGALGSPLFHTGLLLVTLAGVARMLLGANAARDVYEGELVPAGARAFDAQDRGLLAAPVELPEPLRLVELVPSHYPRGDLLGLAARVERPGGSETLAVNAPLDLGATRIYLTQSFGPTAVVSVRWREQDSALAVPLADEGAGYAATVSAAPGLELQLRAPASTGPRPRGELEVRALSGSVLLGAGRLARGAALELPGGGAIVLRDVRWWVRLVASRDPTVWPAYVGFALAVTGVVLMFALVRVDAMILVEPHGDRERVLLALRPQRLAPMFAERFERMVAREAPGERRTG